MPKVRKHKYPRPVFKIRHYQRVWRVAVGGQRRGLRVWRRLFLPASLAVPSDDGALPRSGGDQDSQGKLVPTIRGGEFVPRI